MIKGKRAITLFLACLMLLGTILPLRGVSAEGLTELSKIRISRMEVKDQKGNTIDLKKDIEEEKICRLEIDWDASTYGANLKAGDYFTVSLPKGFKASKNELAVYNFDGVQVANAQINNLNSESGGGTLKIVFTSPVENRTDVKGTAIAEGSVLHNNDFSEDTNFKVASHQGRDHQPLRGGSATVLSDIRLTPIDKDKTEYLTHEKATFDVGFSTSNTSGKLDNTKFIITMPAEYIKVDTLDDHTDDDGIQLSKLDTADSGPELELVDGNWVITYTYDSVPGGYSGDVPISIRTVMGDTPNGYKLPITVKVTDRDGNTLTNGEITKELTFKTKPPKHRKRIGIGDNILDIEETTIEKLRVGPAKDDGKNVLTGELGQTTIPKGHRPVSFRFDLYEKARANKSLGARKYEKVVIEDKLPEGAVFIPSENPGWTEATNENGEKILRYEANYPDGVDFNYNPGTNPRNDKSPVLDKEGKPVFLKLYFPGVTVKENNKDKIFTNSSTVELTPHKMKLDDKVTKVTSDVKFKLEGSRPAVEANKRGWSLNFSDVLEDRSRLQKWQIKVRNFSDVDFTDLEINDFLGNYEDIDSQESKESIDEMNLVKLKIYAKSEKVFTGKFDIYAITRGGSKKEVAKNVSIIKDYAVDLPEDTVSVLLKSTPGSVFYGQGFDAENKDENLIAIDVYSNFKDEKAKGVSEKEKKWNSVKTKAKSSGAEYTQQGKDYIYLLPVKREYKVGKEVVNKLPAYHVDTDVTFKMKAWLGNIYADDSNEVVRIVDLLPEFTEYVENSVQLNKDERKIVKNKEPKVVENYMGLGKTALIWEFGPLENKTGKLISGYMDSNYYNLDFDYKIKIKKGAIGQLQNTVYLGFEGETIRTPESKTSSNDIVDANANGDINDKVSKGADDFRVAPPRELIGVKYVIGSEDKNYISSSGHATAEVDGSGVYKLRLHNTNSIDYDQAILVDVLPHIGDYTLSSAATSGYETEYRKSEFEVKLSGPVKFVDPFKADDVDANNTGNRFDVYYSFERPNSEDNIGKYSFGTEAWKTAEEVGTDWDKVKAIKIQLKEGEVIKGDTYDDFYVEFNMPGDQNLTENNQINNSFAFSTYPSVGSLNESNIVKLKPVRYKVSGISWEDKDNDGIYADGEKLLANTKVRLMKVNEDGSVEVAKDTEGKEYVTTTDKNGQYEFDVYNKGKYFVEMIRPDYYVSTEIVEDSDKGNHMTDQFDEESGEYSYSSSKEFNLHKDHKEQIVNGGWYKNSKTIKLEIPLIKILGLPKADPDGMRETLSYLVNGAPKEWTFNFKIEALSENKEVEKEEQKSITLENQLKQFAENKECLYKMISKMMDRDIKSLDELSDEEVEILYDVARSLLSGAVLEEMLEYTYEIPEGEAREFTFRVTELSSNYAFVKNDRYEERYHYFKYDGENEKNIYHTFNTNYENRGEFSEELVKKIWETNLGEDFNSYRMSDRRAEKYINYLDRDDLIDISYGLGGDHVRVYLVYPFINSILKQPWTPMEVPTREVKVKKEFTDFNGEKLEPTVDEIEVELYKDDEFTGKKLTLNKDNDWSGNFKGLPVYESLRDTTPFNYTVKEVGEERGSIKLEDKWFNVSYTGNMKEGFVITNKESKPWTPMEPPFRSLKVTKAWELNGANKPVEEIEVELYKDGEATGKKVVLNEENKWTSTFENLEVSEELGSTDYYKYTVKEVGEERGSIKLSDKWFNVSYTGNMKEGFTITNKEEPEEPSTNPVLVKTGEDNRLVLYALMMFISASSLLVINYKRRKNEK